ncbi:MAG: beta-ketoacyl-[acyl-carrier-protein] synthase family protein [Phycisphaerales bacterium]
MSRRVVITGIGVVSPLGVGRGPLWEGMCAGRSGIGKPTIFDPSGFATKLAGQLPAEFSAKDFVPKSYRKAVKVMARDSEIAVAAAKLAAEDAGLITRGLLDGAAGTPTYPSDRMGCQIGAGLINAETDELTSALATSTNEQGEFDYRKWGTAEGAGGGGGMNNLQPLWMLKYLPNMLACHVTIIHGCEGPSNTITCAEASGLLCVGEGTRVIQRDAADLCFAGGCESKVNLMGALRWTLLNRLAPCDESDSPESIVRPFDPNAKGTVLGEGGGLVVLEEREKALGRSASIYAEIAGFGAAHSPPPAYSAIPTKQNRNSDDRPGDGVKFAVEAALADAGIRAHDIDAIVPTGSGIRDADSEEAIGLRAVFGDRLDEVPLITVTPFVGQSVAGHGGIQLAAAALAVKNQHLPARINSGTPSSGMHAGETTQHAATLRYVLVVSSALGGQNAAVVLRQS